MSTIKLEFPNTQENIQAAVNFLSALSGTPIGVKTMQVVDAEEVEAKTPVKTPTPRPSRAKAKAPEPVEEIEEDGIETEIEDNRRERGAEGWHTSEVKERRSGGEYGIMRDCARVFDMVCRGSLSYGFLTGD